jgi:glutathione synthase/RimK-type ligase-like ATP-grasp enzyme
VLDENWEKGRIPPLRQWQLGWSKVMRELTDIAGPGARWLTPPEDAVSLFDKDDCQRRLEARGVPVPRAWGLARDYSHMIEERGREGCRRFFLKSCHGSSASGVMAIEHGAGGLQAFTTVALERSGPEPVMYNSRKVRRLRGDEVRETADAVCRLAAMMQEWVPKAGWQGHALDFRVVTIGGAACHIVPRLSRTPFTTLQLGAQRGDAAALRAAAGEPAWQRLTDAAARAAAAYPRALTTGVDVAMTPGWSRAAVLEVNAFGDLLPGVLHEGRDTYTCQLAAAGIL